MGDGRLEVTFEVFDQPAPEPMPMFWSVASLDPAPQSPLTVGPAEFLALPVMAADWHLFSV